VSWPKGRHHRGGVAPRYAPPEQEGSGCLSAHLEALDATRSCAPDPLQRQPRSGGQDPRPGGTDSLPQDSSLQHRRAAADTCGAPRSKPPAPLHPARLRGSRRVPFMDSCHPLRPSFPLMCTSASFEVLNFSFRVFPPPTRCEGPKILRFPVLGFFFREVQAVLTCFEFPDQSFSFLWTSIFLHFLDFFFHLSCPWHRTFPHRGQARGAISETLQRVHVPRPAIS